MKILYDYEIFQIQKFGGISRCFAELIKHIPNGTDYKIGIKESNNVYLKNYNLVKNISPIYRDSQMFLKKIGYKVPGLGYIYRVLARLLKLYDSTNINKKYTIDLLQNENFDIFHATYYNDYYFPYLRNTQLVITIHDMIAELILQEHGKNSQKRRKEKCINKANHIIVVSENTKKDLLKIYNIDPSKISVIYHGAAEVNYKKLKKIFYFNYILFVGARKGYKNFIKFLYEYSFFQIKNPSIHLVCTGNPFNKNEKKLIKKLKLEKKVHQIFVNENELYSLYKFADVFVFPSEYEGFGIPILEAFKLRCPTLLNNSSCFPEIAKDGAIYFDIKNKGDLAKKLMDFYRMDKNEIEDLKHLADERLKNFSWEKSASQLSGIYNKLIDNVNK